VTPSFPEDTEAFIHDRAFLPFFFFFGTAKKASLFSPLFSPIFHQNYAIFSPLPPAHSDTLLFFFIKFRLIPFPPSSPFFSGNFFLTGVFLVEKNGSPLFFLKAYALLFFPFYV